MPRCRSKFTTTDGFYKHVERNFHTWEEIKEEKMKRLGREPSEEELIMPKNLATADSNAASSVSDDPENEPERGSGTSFPLADPLYHVEEPRSKRAATDVSSTSGSDHPQPKPTFHKNGGGKGYKQILDRYSGLREAPFVPFSDVKDFGLARWFCQSGVSDADVGRYLATGMANRKTGITTKERYNKNLDDMIKLPEFKPKIQVQCGPRITDTGFIYYRDIKECAKELIGRRYLKDFMAYEPVRYRNAEGGRIYTELHTANWWWRQQSRVSKGSTIVPLIFSSDGTHLTTYSGDKKAWPVYMTIGNIHSEVRGKPNMCAQVLVGHLPVPKKMTKIRGSANTDQLNRGWVRDSLQRAMDLLMAPVRRRVDEDPNEFIQTSEEDEWRCADGIYRRCVPLVAYWCADHMEYVTMMGIKTNACPKCSVGVGGFANYKTKKELEVIEHVRCDKEVREKIDKWEEAGGDIRISESTGKKAPGPEAAARRAIEEWLNARGLKPNRNMFYGLRGAVESSDMHVPDTLHSLYLGMLRYGLTWMVELLGSYKRLDIFDAAWKKVPVYGELSVYRDKTFLQMTQFQGKEMRSVGRYALALFAVALRNPASSEIKFFKEALDCMRALVYFVLMAQYKSHDEKTIGYMRGYLAIFYEKIGVFKEFRCTQAVANKAKDAQKGLKEKHKIILDDAIEKKYTVKKLAAIKKTHLKELQKASAEYKEDAVNFNFVKMHLNIHFGSAISEYGPVPQQSTETGERCHVLMIKNMYDKSNKTGDNVLGQMNQRHARLDGMSQRMLDLQQMSVEDHENGMEINEDLQFSLGLYSNTDNNAMSKHFRDFRAESIRPSFPLSLNSINIPTPMKKFRGLDKLGIKHVGQLLPSEAHLTINFIKFYWSSIPERSEDEWLRRCQRDIYKHMSIPVKKLHEYGRVSYTVFNVTSSREYYKRFREDAIFLKLEKAPPGLGDNDLGGMVPALVKGMWRIGSPYEAGVDRQRTQDAVLVEKLFPISDGKCNKFTGFVHVRGGIYADELVPIDDVLMMAHLIELPQEEGVEDSTPNDEAVPVKREWIVNNCVDIETFNTIFCRESDIPGDPEIEKIDVQMDENNNGSPPGESGLRTDQGDGSGVPEMSMNEDDDEDDDEDEDELEDGGYLRESGERGHIGNEDESGDSHGDRVEKNDGSEGSIDESENDESEGGSEDEHVRYHLPYGDALMY